MKRYSFCSIAAALLVALTWVGCGEDKGPLAPTTKLIQPLASKPVDAGKKALIGGIKVLIGFKGAPDTAVVQSVGGIVKYTYDLVPAVAATIPEAAMDTLRAHPDVAYVELDSEVYATDVELDNSWGVKRIGAGNVHNSGNKGAGVKVGILDTGIDYTHPDLDGNYAGGYDFVNRDPDPRDDHGHGTYTAGVVGAEDNGSGVVGVAPKARLYALKVLDASASGFSSDVIAALEWCVKNGIRVTNNSYATNLDVAQLTTLKAAFDNSAAAGIIHVAAAGNSGNSLGIGDNVVYPARYESVVAVAAVDRNDARASFSSTGPDVEMAAPGVEITSTIRGGGYITGSGTSGASPHVAGTAALFIAAGAADVRRQLQTTADDLGAPGRDTQYGYGLVDADAILGSPSGGSATLLIWDGETPGATFHYGSANNTQAFKGIWCFEGIPDPWHSPGIGLNGLSTWRVNLSSYKEISFYAKADMTGRTFDFSVYAWPDFSNSVNIDPYIVGGGGLTTTYKQVRIPISALKTLQYSLDKVEILYFGTAKPTSGHKIYIDEIYANQ